MKIGILGSMQFTENMLEARDQLRALGHDAFVTDLHTPLYEDVMVGVVCGGRIKSRYG